MESQSIRQRQVMQQQVMEGQVVESLVVERQPAEPFQRRTVSFVRRDNRLAPRLQRAWDDHYEALFVDVPRAQASTSVAPGFVLDAMRDFGRVAPLVVEIGSGTGDAVVQGARARPGTNFLAVEVYRPGLAATAAKIVRHNLTNVRLVQADAMQVLEHMLRPASVAEIWVFFADPWHKLRHHKRRLVNPAFAEFAASRLARGGTLRLATDWPDYARQMREVLDACGSLTNPHGGNPGSTSALLNNKSVSHESGSHETGSHETGSHETAGREAGFAPRFDGRAMTRFESKGIEAGRTIYDLELQRV